MTIANIMIVEDEIIVANDIKARLQKMNYAITSMVNTGGKGIGEC